MKRLIALLVLASASTFAQTNLGLRVSDTGVLLRPTNFWNANAADILAGIGGSSSGIAEAPSDGVGYVRRNAAWIQSAWSYLTGTPTTLVGYGITDGQPLDADLTDLADGSLTGSKVGSGIAAGNITTGTIGTARLGSGTADGTTFLRGDNTWAVPSGGGGGSGSVTSVGLSAPSWLTVGGSPVTTSGTLALTGTAQTSNTFLAGPSSGLAAAPTFRSIVNDDLPSSITINDLTTTTLGAGTLNIVTQRVGELIVTNGVTIGGVRNTSWPGGGGGSGDVVGPSSATDNALVRFDSTTGKLVQNSSATVDDSGTLTVSNLTVNGTGAGSITISDSTGTNGWTLASPSSVTSTPRLTLPAAASNGIMIVTNSGTNMVAQFVAHPGANGKVMIATNTPAQGFFFGDPPTSGVGGSSTNYEVLNVGTLNLTNALANASLDADLAALGNNSTAGLLARTGAGTADARTITAASALDLTVSNGDGVSGNPSIALSRTATLASDPALASDVVAIGTSGIIFEGTAADANEGLLTSGAITADRTWTMPDASGNVVIDSATQTLTGKTLTGPGISSPIFTGFHQWPVTALTAFSSVTNYVAQMNVGSIRLITAANDVNFLHSTNGNIGRETTILILASGADRLVTLPPDIWIKNASSFTVTNGTIATLNILWYGSDATNVIATVRSGYFR